MVCIYNGMIKELSKYLIIDLKSTSIDFTLPTG